mgnify:CR=1 FL=1
MNTCNRISNYIATKDNMDLAGVTNNSYVGIQYVQNTLPDAVILDLELHHGGGNGLFFLSDLNKLGLEKKPYILSLLTTPAKSRWNLPEDLVLISLSANMKILILRNLLLIFSNSFFL